MLTIHKFVSLISTSSKVYFSLIYNVMYNLTACVHEKKSKQGPDFLSLFTILMDLLCLRVPQRPRCPDLRSNDTALKHFIQLEALTLDPQDEKIRREVFRLYKRLLRLHEGLPEDFASHIGRPNHPKVSIT